MSSSISVYVGPYIKINVSDAPVTLAYEGCNNDKCSEFEVRSDGGKFCKECGTKIEMLSVDRVQSVKWSDFNEFTNYDYECDFYSPEFLGGPDENIVICDGVGEHMDVDGGVFPLSAVDVDLRRLHQFKTEHQDTFNKIAKFFPKGHVTVEIGICSYWG